MRRRGQNIFEISDELWRQGEAETRADEVPVGLFDRDRPRSDAHGGSDPLKAKLGLAGDAPLRPTLGVQAPPRRGRLLVAGGAVVAGVIAIAPTTMPDRDWESTLGPTTAPKPPVAANQPPTVRRPAARRRHASSGHAEPPHAPKSTGHPRTRPAPVGQANARPIGARVPSMSRAPEPATTPALGHEFSFER